MESLAKTSKAGKSEAVSKSVTLPPSAILVRLFRLLCLARLKFQRTSCSHPGRKEHVTSHNLRYGTAEKASMVVEVTMAISSIQQLNSFTREQATVQVT